MSKKKNTELDCNNIFASLAACTNGELLSNMRAARYFVDTGNLAFNYISSGRFITGGIPGGRITEFYGESSTAKSLWATNVLFGVQKLNGVAVLLDVEHAANPEWIEKASHLDLERVVRYTPTTLEECFLKMYNVIRVIRSKDKEIPIMIVYDSIAVSPCEREFKEIELPEDYTDADFKRLVERHEQPGERAKVCSKELRKLNGMLEEVDATILIINQVRNKIGAQKWEDPNVTAGGGKALEFYTSQRFRTSASKQIKNPKLGTIVGVNVKITNKKNRFFRPFAAAQNIQLLFDKGVNPVSGLLSCLLQAERITSKSPGNYLVAKDYLPDNKDEYLFKSSKERDDVPIDLLLDCPKIIDAESRDQVEEYLLPFADFNSIIESGEIEESPLADMLGEGVPEEV